MTYGWAIIIVIIVGVALWRLGVFTPSPGKTSTGFDEFYVGTNFKITSGGDATLILVNQDKEGRSVTLNSVTVGGADCTGDTGSKGVSENWTISCTGVPSGASGSPYTGVAVAVNYTVGGLSYLETGKISGKYE